jgi:hypothetical protein
MKTPLTLNHNKAVFLIFLLALLHFFSTLSLLNHTRFFYDVHENFGQIHTLTLNLTHTILASREILDGNIFGGIAFAIDYWKPGAFYALSVPFFMLIQDLNAAISAVNSVFLFALLVAVYFIAAKAADKKSGLLAAIIFYAFPLSFVMFRWFCGEILLITVIAWIIVISIYGKTGVKYAVAYFFLFTLGMLAKEEFFAYVPVFILFFISNGSNLTKKNAALTVGAFVLAFGTAQLLWYGTHAPNLIQYLTVNAGVEQLSGAWYYFKSLFFFGITPVFSVLLIAFILKAVWQKRYLFVLPMLYILTLFSIPANKELRRVFPLAVFAAVLIAVEIFKTNGKLKKALFYFVILFAALQFTYINYIGGTGIFCKEKFNGFNYFKPFTYHNYSSAAFYGDGYKAVTERALPSGKGKIAFIDKHGTKVPGVANIFNYLDFTNNKHLKEGAQRHIFVPEDVIESFNIGDYTAVITSKHNKNIVNMISKNPDFEICALSEFENLHDYTDLVFYIRKNRAGT